MCANLYGAISAFKQRNSKFDRLEEDATGVVEDDKVNNEVTCALNAQVALDVAEGHVRTAQKCRHRRVRRFRFVFSSGVVTRRKTVFVISNEQTLTQFAALKIKKNVSNLHAFTKQNCIKIW